MMLISLHKKNIMDFVDEDAREAVQFAMDHWMAHTCIKFVERKPDEQDYVEIVEMNGYVLLSILMKLNMLETLIKSHIVSINCEL